MARRPPRSATPPPPCRSRSPSWSGRAGTAPEERRGRPAGRLVRARSRRRRAGRRPWRWPNWHGVTRRWALD
ncbi:hypothetical protein NKH77_19660 [Streptomyces sp. M19]